MIERIMTDETEEVLIVVVLEKVERVVVALVVQPRHSLASSLALHPPLSSRSCFVCHNRRVGSRPPGSRTPSSLAVRSLAERQSQQDASGVGFAALCGLSVSYAFTLSRNHDQTYRMAYKSPAQ